MRDATLGQRVSRWFRQWGVRQPLAQVADPRQARGRGWAMPQVVETGLGALVLHDTGGTGITFTELQRTASAHHVQAASTERTRHWRLPPNGELRLPFSFAHYCPQAFESCRGPTIGDNLCRPSSI
jgi:hypothetical protein